MQWDKYTLRNQLKEGAFHHQHTVTNNFATTITDSWQRLKAIEMFRDEYLLDFVNVEELGERDKEDIDERIVEYAVRDYQKPMGVATYKTLADMPEKMRNALPSIEEIEEKLKTKNV